MTALEQGCRTPGRRGIWDRSVKFHQRFSHICSMLCDIVQLAVLSVKSVISRGTPTVTHFSKLRTASISVSPCDAEKICQPRSPLAQQIQGLLVFYNRCQPHPAWLNAVHDDEKTPITSLSLSQTRNSISDKIPFLYAWKLWALSLTCENTDYILMSAHEPLPHALSLTVISLW